MAKPPTGLTKLLYETDGTAESVIAVLGRSGCLSEHARNSPSVATSEVARMLANHARVQATREAGGCGPTWADVLAEMLIESPLLNAHGKKLDRSPG